MASEFAGAVDDGLNLSKRIYYGKGVVSAPMAPQEMTRSPDSYLPTGPMVYAVVADPAAVDNPDVPSYQPYVHGRCDPAALIPLQMHAITMEIDCYLDTAFVSVAGVWRVHCIMASRRCDCLAAIPVGEQGLLLGVEVSMDGRSYNSQLITMEDAEDGLNLAKAKARQFLKFQTFTFKVPQVEGGSVLSIKANWSQKLLYDESQFLLSIPFSFPWYVTPVAKKIPKREKIVLNVNSGTGTELLCKSTSHPLMELRRGVGSVGFSYEAEVHAWSTVDFKFFYSIPSGDIFGGLLLQSPPMHDFDERDMFCFFIYPGNNQSKKVFRKEVVYVIDISGSMQGELIMKVKDALSEALSELTPKDTFNIIAFNDEALLFSSVMEAATEGAVSNAIGWISSTFVADGGTNIMLPLQQAVKLLADSTDAIPLIFLVTDGAVENEREICNLMKHQLSSDQSVRPRLCTFGIGTYCNHYFLQALSQIGRGQYESALDSDSVGLTMRTFFAAASSIVMADLTLGDLEDPNLIELYPSRIPDLSTRRPLIVSGRYSGNFPELLEVSGVLADNSIYTLQLNAQWIKDMPLDRILAKRHIDILTTEAWLQQSRELETKVAKMSIQSMVPSEYTCMLLLETVSKKIVTEQKAFIAEVYNKINSKKVVDWKGQKAVVLGNLGTGFGNLVATMKNIEPWEDKETKQPDATKVIVQAASNCCSSVMNRCCCMCFIQTCTFLNNQCTIVFTQLCTALACFECINCCFEICDCPCLS